jgi:hypothetical protein
VIRIDVHPTWENSTNMSRMLPTPVHARPAYAFYGQFPYVTTFHWFPRSQNMPLHPEEVMASKDRLAQSSSWVTLFLLPCDNPGVGERGFSRMITQLHQHAIGTFNTCSQGPTHRSLIDTGGATTLEVPVCHIPTL